MHLRRWGRRATTIAVVMVSTLTVWTTAAFAQYPGGSMTPTPPSTPPTEVKGGKFPSTGADVLRYVVIAFVILLVGLALLRLSRSAAARDD